MTARKSLFILMACTALVASSCGSDESSDDSPAAVDPTEATGGDTVADTDTDTDAADGVAGDTVADADAVASDPECPPLEGTSEQLQTFDAPPPMCLDPNASYQALVVTNKGEFTIDLDQDKAPETTNSFVFLARNQYFDNTVCHRIIPGFVVQCGDPTATGTGGPGYTIIDEPPAAGEYQIGSIAMANTGAPNSGGSQFFIITGEQGAALPPQYSLFGEVIDGFDGTVVSMEAAGTATGDPSEPIEIQSITIIQP